jgi:hypothetical protein
VGDEKFSETFDGNWRHSKEDKRDALQQYLSNPQNLNSYGYALNNPLRYKDPTGENPLLIAAGVGATIGGTAGLLGQYFADVNRNIIEGRGFHLNTLQPRSSIREYETSLATGAFSGALAPFGIVGLVSGGLVEAGGSVFEDVQSGKDIDYFNAAVNGVTAVAVPVGVDKAFGKVAGRSVSTFSKYLFIGAHTQREAIIQAVQVGLTALAGTFRQITTSLRGLNIQE